MHSPFHLLFQHSPCPTLQKKGTYLTYAESSSMVQDIKTWGTGGRGCFFYPYQNIPITISPLISSYKMFTIFYLLLVKPNCLLAVQSIIS